MPSIASRKKRTIGYRLAQQHKRKQQAAAMAAAEEEKKRRQQQQVAPNTRAGGDVEDPNSRYPEEALDIGSDTEVALKNGGSGGNVQAIFRNPSQDSADTNGNDRFVEDYRSGESAAGNSGDDTTPAKSAASPSARSLIGADGMDMGYGTTNLEQLGSGSDHDGSILKFSQQAMTEDIYALMSTCRVCSLGWIFAFSIFLIQMGILILALADLIDMSDQPVQRNGIDNRLNLPADTDLQVTIAQFLGIVLIVNFAVAEGDMLRGITHMVDGYDPDLMDHAPHAKRVKWHFAGVCQTLVGLFMIMDAFILMMQSVTVIEMCLNFAALSFVQDFDDAAFAMGSMGLLSPKIQANCLKVGHLMVKSENRSRTSHVRKLTVGLLTICLYIPYFVITGWKFSGYFMCESLYIQFGDAYGPEWPYYSGRFNSMGKHLPDRANGRIVYIEPTKTLQMAFCASIPAWTVSNRTEVGDNYCDYLIRSTDTSTFDVMDVASDTWYAATTTVGDVPMDWMAVVCADCNDVLCNGNVGKCVNNQCECHEGFMGLNCEFAVPDCTFLGLDMRSKGALPSLPFASLFLENEFAKMEDEFRLADEIYTRPIYASWDETGNVDALILFVGRRWLIMGTPQENVSDFKFQTFFDNLKINDVKNNPLLNLVNTTRTFTSLRPFFFSEPVDYGTKTHKADPIQTKWVLAVKDEERELLGYRGDDTFDVSAQFICSHCNDTTAPCLNGGICNATTTYCECPRSYGGFRCEYSYNCEEVGCENGGTCDKVLKVCRDCDALYYGNLCQFERVVVDETGNIDYNSQAAILGDDFFVCINGTSCNNGGWCTSNITACSCPPEFTGDHCELLVENSTWVQGEFVCHNDTCINEGWCVGDAKKCSCPEPFTGTYCEIVETDAEVHHCHNDTCLNDGYCASESEACVCQDGYSGDFCESSTTLIEGHELCSNSTCLNGGYCRNIAEVCYCPEDFEGTYCENFANGTSAANASIATTNDADGDGGAAVGNPDTPEARRMSHRELP